MRSGPWELVAILHGLENGDFLPGHAIVAMQWWWKAEVNDISLLCSASIEHLRLVLLLVGWSTY